MPHLAPSVAAPGAMRSSIDHLVVVADTLEQGADWCDATLGCRAGPGGRHALMGTYNRLLPIGGPGWPQAYLEIIAIDPAADAGPAPGWARWFGMDDPMLRDAVRRQPRLVHFVAQTSSLAAARAALAVIGEDVGEPVATSRPGPLGEIRWRITVRRDGRPQQGGALPALIEWEGPHPSAAMSDAGVRLLRLEVAVDHPEVVRHAHAAIGLGSVEVAARRAASPTLRAVLSTPRGEVALVGGFPA